MSAQKKTQSCLTAAYWQACCRITTRRLCLMAVLVAMQLILGRILSFNISETLRLNFGFLPTAVAGLLMGPVAAALVGGVSDVLGAVLFPSGAINLVLTLIKLLEGLIFGLMLFRRPVSWLRSILCCLMVALICNVALNSMVLVVMYGVAKNGLWVWLLPRIVKNAVQLPFNTVLLYGVWQLLSRLPQRLTGEG